MLAVVSEWRQRCEVTFTALSELPSNPRNERKTLSSTWRLDELWPSTISSFSLPCFNFKLHVSKQRDVQDLKA